MSENVRIITQKEGADIDTKKFKLLNLGYDHEWLVDPEHPGYAGCVTRAFQIAVKRGDEKEIERVGKLQTTILKQYKSKLEVVQVAEVVDEKPKPATKKKTATKRK